MKHYRKYKIYAYIKELEKIFRNAKTMRDYGKHLIWPHENFAVRHIISVLKIMYERWWAWMILRLIPREDWPQLRLKVCYIYQLKCLTFLVLIFYINIMLDGRGNSFTFKATSLGTR